MASQGPRTPDETRLADWCREHGPAVRGYLRAITGRTDTAGDLTQEVFCRAWQARRAYREQGHARAYLLRIADRVACDHGRKKRPEVNLDGGDWRQVEPAGTEHEPDDAVAQAQAGRRLATAMGRLSDAQRRVLLLRYYGQLSFAEIAETMNCPLNTALSHCRRGLLALRGLLVENVT